MYLMQMLKVKVTLPILTLISSTDITGNIPLLMCNRHDVVCCPETFSGTKLADITAIDAETGKDLKSDLGSSEILIFFIGNYCVNPIHG